MGGRNRPASTENQPEKTEMNQSATPSLILLRHALVLLVLLSVTTNAWAQRRTVTVEPRTAESTMVEQLVRGAITPVPVNQTPAPSTPAPPPTSIPGQPVETSLLIPVQFGFDSAELTPQARSVLDVMARAMNDPALTGHRFLLEGHTDTTGGWEYNRVLSERRAAAVAGYLISRGVRPDRLITIGYSWNRLLPYLTPTDPRHRRVEVGRLQ